MWIRNCWYVVAWDHEIPPADAPTLFRRVVLAEPLLVYGCMRQLTEDRTGQLNGFVDNYGSF